MILFNDLGCSLFELLAAEIFTSVQRLRELGDDIGGHVPGTRAVTSIIVQR
jgi:hypothetical protein